MLISAVSNELIELDDSCCGVEDVTTLVIGWYVENKLEGLDIVVCSALLHKELFEGELLDEYRLIALISAVDKLKELDDVCCAVEDGTRLMIGWSAEDELEEVWVVVCSEIDVEIGSLL